MRAWILVAVIVASPALAQLRGNPVQRFGTLVTAPVEVPSFASYKEFYGYLAKKQSLPEIESRVSIDSFSDYSIKVVNLSTVGGSYSLFVVREKEDHLVLLGEMNGRSYEADTRGGHLEFVLDSGGRYQVDGDFLINLADLAELDRNDPVELDLEHAF